MPERTFSSPEYRYGFNGKEKDENEEWGSLTHYDYGFRIYNPGIGRFLSVDPLRSEYPELTPYQFASNTPIWAIDRDGMEAWESQWWKDFGDALVTNLKSSWEMAVDLSITAIKNPHKVPNLTFVFESKTAGQIGKAFKDNPAGATYGLFKNLGELGQDVQTIGIAANFFRKDGGRRHGNASFEFASFGAGKYFSVARFAKIKVLSRSTPGTAGSGNLGSGPIWPNRSARAISSPKAPDGVSTAHSSGKAMYQRFDDYIAGGGTPDIILGTREAIAQYAGKMSNYKNFFDRGFSNFDMSVYPSAWGTSIQQAIAKSLNNNGFIRFYLDNLTDLSRNTFTIQELSMVLKNSKYLNKTKFFEGGVELKDAARTNKINELKEGLKL